MLTSATPDKVIGPENSGVWYGGAYEARIYTLILNTFRDLSRFLKETAGRSDAKLARSGARLQATAEMKGGELAITFHPTT